MGLKYLKNINFLTIIGLIGIISVQLFWIFFSYKESISHKNEHIKLVIAETRDEICANISEEIDGNSIETLLQNIMNQSTEKTKFGYEIWENGIKHFSKGEIKNRYRVETNILCPARNSKIKIVIYPDYQSFSALSGIIIWAIISAIFLIIFTLLFAYHANKYRSIQELEKTKNDFIANMTHELKTPIATISVASEMLLKKSNPNLNQEKVDRYTQIIYDENRRLKTLVDKVLQISIFEKGNQNFHFENIDLHKIILEVFNPMFNLASEKEIKLKAELQAKKTTVNGDIIHLKNLVTNLIENSIKYSNPNTEILVLTKNAGNSFILEVADQGIGIEEEHKEKVFEKFYRIQSGDIHTVKGFGLGLYYVKKVVEGHFGLIKIKDNKPSGTIFIIELPTI